MKALSTEACEPDYEKMLANVNKEKGIVDDVLKSIRKLDEAGVYINIGNDNEKALYAFIGALTQRVWEQERTIYQLTKKISA